MRTRLLPFVSGVVLLSCALVAAIAGAQGAMDLSKAPRVSQEEFKKLQAAGSILVVDVRDADSYKAGHIPGAISIPLDQVTTPEHLKELKAAGKPIVTYCA